MLGRLVKLLTRAVLPRRRHNAGEQSAPSPSAPRPRLRTRVPRRASGTEPGPRYGERAAGDLGIRRVVVPGGGDCAAVVDLHSNGGAEQYGASGGLWRTQRVLSPTTPRARTYSSTFPAGWRATRSRNGSRSSRAVSVTRRRRTRQVGPTCKWPRVE